MGRKRTHSQTTSKGETTQTNAETVSERETETIAPPSTLAIESSLTTSTVESSTAEPSTAEPSTTTSKAPSTTTSTVSERRWRAVECKGVKDTIWRWFPNVSLCVATLDFEMQKASKNRTRNDDDDGAHRATMSRHIVTDILRRGDSRAYLGYFFRKAVRVTECDESTGGGDEKRIKEKIPNRFARDGYIVVTQQLTDGSMLETRFQQLGDCSTHLRKLIPPLRFSHPRIREAAMLGERFGSVKITYEKCKRWTECE